MDTRPEINDLSLLSLLAAHELERLERKEPSDGQYLAALRDHLSEQVPDSDDADIRSLAPSTALLYRKAVMDATNKEPADFPSLIKELNRIIVQLRTASETVSSTKRRKPALGDLKSLFAFVISLHDQLLAQKQRLASSRASHQFRV